MRRVALVVAVALLAGCTGSFPADARIVAELLVGDLGPGAAERHRFVLDGPAGYLVVGYRTGPGDGVFVTLGAPDGTRYDTSAGAPPVNCAVRDAAAGAWVLEVATDPVDGHLAGGKFTVRAGPGAPPALFPCADDVFPGAARNVTVAWWVVNLTAGEETTLPFAQPYALAGLAVRVAEAPRNTTPAEPGNGTAAPDPAAANATSSDAPLRPVLAFQPPQGDPVAPADLRGPIAEGAWSLRVVLPADAPRPLRNATVVVTGTGA